MPKTRRRFPPGFPWPLSKGVMCVADDRNFCTLDFLGGIADRQAYFVTRQHKSMPWEEVDGPGAGRPGRGGRRLADNGFAWSTADGTSHFAWRMKLLLDQPTRDGEHELFLLTNLPAADADALRVACLYRRRWTIEIMFRELADFFENEIDTLAYPKAALFGFCAGLAAYNVLAALKAALRASHGAEKIEAELSGYYVADEIAGTYRGMMIAIPPAEWLAFRTWSAAALATLLRELAKRVPLEQFRKNPRSPKKPQPKRHHNPQKPHVSTAKLLAERKMQRE